MNSLPISLILLPALSWVVLSDLLYRRIGNRLVLALLVAWMGVAIWMALSGKPGWQSDIVTGVLVGCAVLVIGYLLFVMRWMGAGDAKLMAVLCLWLGHDAYVFLMATSLAGGVLALGLPLLRHVEKVMALFVLRLAGWFPHLGLAMPVALSDEAMHMRQGIPYGLAIAAGAGIVLWLGL